MKPLPVVDEREVEFTAVRAQGAGGQNVNKVSSAVHLRFDVAASSLPGDVKARLLGSSDRRLSDEGVIVIKAQRHRSQDLNRRDALARLNALVARRRAAGAAQEDAPDQGVARAPARKQKRALAGQGDSSQGRRVAVGPIAKRCTRVRRV